MMTITVQIFICTFDCLRIFVNEGAVMEQYTTLRMGGSNGRIVTQEHPYFFGVKLKAVKRKTALN